ncbi:MFS transporter [Candidatus Micrarchaeota archaeon]|nr:MFS transporter [Candidatus Micrarchaeota archaeon]
MDAQQDDLEKKLEKSKDYSIKDGSFYSVMVGFGVNYLTPFALRLGASVADVGLLQTLPQLLGSAAQLLYSRVSRVVKSRQKLVLSLVSIQCLAWLGLFALTLLSGDSIVSWLILFYSISVLAESFANPAWTSWMGDIVKEKDRPQYFGKRNEITGFAAFVSSIAAGWALGLFQEWSRAALGFTVIFAIAFLGRLVSLYYLSRKFEPKLEERTQEITFRSFLKSLRQTNFGALVLYNSVLSFGVFIAAPYFSVYALSVLKFDYFTYAVVFAVAQISLFLTMVYWGDVVNKLGSKSVLYASGLVVAIIPLYWALFKNPFLLFFFELFSGLGWAGQRIATFNLILKTTPEKDKSKFVAYYNVLQGIAIFAGGMVGALLAWFFEANSISLLGALPAVFVVSSALRFAAVLLFARRIEEQESKGFESKTFLFKTITLYPAKSAMYEVQSGLRRGLSKAFELEKDFHTLKKKSDEMLNKMKIKKIEF